METFGVVTRFSLKQCGAVQGRRAIHSPEGQTHVKPCATEKEGARGGTTGSPTLTFRGERGAEHARAGFVGGDTLGPPTYRHARLPGYQSGREFEVELLEQLDLLPGLAASTGIACARAPGYEADDFLAAAVRAEEARGGRALVA